MILSKLIQLLSTTPEPMTSSRLARALAMPIEPAELAYWIRFNSETYGRHEIARSPHFEMLCLCWSPGQRSLPHEHGGSSSAMKVIHGIAQEDLYARQGDRVFRAASRLIQPGEIAATTRELIHAIGNPPSASEGLVTLHVYSPPLGAFETFSDADRIDLLRDVRRNTG
jgi:cysteine dioxygenase